MKDALRPSLQSSTNGLSLEHYHNSMKRLEDYMLADQDPSIQLCLSKGAHHNQGDNCVIKLLFRTVYQSSYFPILAQW